MLLARVRNRFMAFSFIQSYDGWAHFLRVRAIRCLPWRPYDCLRLLCCGVPWHNLFSVARAVQWWGALGPAALL